MFEIPSKYPWSPAHVVVNVQRHRSTKVCRFYLPGNRQLVGRNRRRNRRNDVLQSPICRVHREAYVELDVNRTRQTLLAAGHFPLVHNPYISAPVDDLDRNVSL